MYKDGSIYTKKKFMTKLPKHSNILAFQASWTMSMQYNEKRLHTKMENRILKKKLQMVSPTGVNCHLWYKN